MKNVFGIESRIKAEKHSEASTPVEFVDDVDINGLRRDLAADLRSRIHEHSLAVSLAPDEVRFIIEELER